MIRLVTALVLAATTVAATTAAQRTWIVDASNRPGTDYTKIQAAIDAARANDILHIRTGSYEGFTLKKGLRLLADPGVTVRTGLGLFGRPIHVREVPAGQFAVLRGFTANDTRGLGLSVQIAQNKGMVQLEEVRILVPSRGSNSESVRVLGSVGVSFQRCEIQSGMHAQDSALMLTQCTLNRVKAPFQIFASRPALTAARSRVTLAQCFLKGQDGARPYNFSQPALAATASTIRITGLQQSAIRAGIGSGESIPALSGDGASSLMLDPRPTLLPSGGAQKHVGFGKIASRYLTYLGVQGGKLGSTMTLAQHGRSGHFFALSASLPHTPFHWPPFGYLWLNQGVRIHILAGVYDKTHLVQLSFRVPNQLDLRGLPLGWHAVSGPWPDLVYSNAVFTTLH